MRWISTSLENVLEIDNELFRRLKKFLDHPEAQYQYQYEYWYQYQYWYQYFDFSSTNTSTGTSIKTDTWYHSTVHWISMSLEIVWEIYNDIFRSLKKFLDQYSGAQY